VSSSGSRDIRRSISLVGGWSWKSPRVSFWRMVSGLACRKWHRVSIRGLWWSSLGLRSVQDKTILLVEVEGNLTECWNRDVEA